MFRQQLHELMRAREAEVLSATLAGISAGAWGAGAADERIEASEAAVEGAVRRSKGAKHRRPSSGHRHQSLEQDQLAHLHGSEETAEAHGQETDVRQHRSRGAGYLRVPEPSSAHGAPSSPVKTARGGGVVASGGFSAGYLSRGGEGPAFADDSDAEPRAPLVPGFAAATLKSPPRYSGAAPLAASGSSLYDQEGEGGREDVMFPTPMGGSRKAVLRETRASLGPVVTNGTLAWKRGEAAGAAADTDADIFAYGAPSPFYPPHAATDSTYSSEAVLPSPSPAAAVPSSSVRSQQQRPSSSSSSSAHRGGKSMATPSPSSSSPSRRFASAVPETPGDSEVKPQRASRGLFEDDARIVVTIPRV
jgi:hypothetical protein